MDKKTAIRDLGQLLPLDEETLGQIVNNSLQLPTQSAISKYWLDLLGESPDALNFISKMTSTKPSSSSSSSSSASGASTPSRSASRQVRTTAQPPSPSSRGKSTPIHPSRQHPQSNQSKPDLNAWNQPTFEKPKLNNTPRLKKATATTTSELLNKPVEKKSKQSAKRDRQKKIDNLKDIDSILTNLEVQNPDEDALCNCKATIHPLFEVAPNCLNCGKIICAKEGLRPCSFCGMELISPEEKAQIIKLLQSEKDTLEETPVVKKVLERSNDRKAKKITITSGAGVNLWKQQDSLFEKLEKQKLAALKAKEQQVKEERQINEQTSELKFYEQQKEIDPDLLKAKKNLENLLNFQDNGAERTKIIDQASDFDLPTGTNLNIWSSSVEKALQLKKQQRQLRRQEKKENQLTGKSKRVVNISIGKDGKATLHEVIDKRGVSQVESDFDDSDENENNEDIAKLEEELKKKKDANAEDEFKNVWDPAKDAAKWEAPKYISGDQLENDNDDEEEPEDELKLRDRKWDRIQKLTDANNEEELDEIVTLI